MDLTLDYQKNHELAERFRLAMADQINGVIIKNNISLGVPIESRVKSLSSIEDKLKRKPKEIDSVILLDDLVGIRLILLFKSDVKKTCDLLSDNFDVLQFEDTSSRLDENQFGYQSNHLIIKVPNSWLNVPSFSDFSNIKVEVQVRTLSKHIWAVASHKLQYKKESNIPIPLRRSIHRVSALLETVDLEFERLIEDRQTYLDVDIAKLPSTTNMDVDILESVCDEMLPALNKDGTDEIYSELLDELIEFNLNTSGRLKSIITSHLPSVLIKDREMVDNGGHFEFEELERAKLGVYYTHAGLVRGCIDLEIGQAAIDYRIEKVSKHE